jgi:hypothetical protein
VFNLLGVLQNQGTHFDSVSLPPFDLCIRVALRQVRAYMYDIPSCHERLESNIYQPAY